MNSTDRNYYDNEFCGKIPLHQINSIQPQGAILVISLQYEIVQVSENIAEVISITKENLLQKKISDFLIDEDAKIISEILSTKTTTANFLRFKGGQNNIFCFFHYLQNYTIIEVERFEEKTIVLSIASTSSALRNSLDKIRQHSITDQLTQVAAKEVKKLTGFDRVMIYRFDDEWNGTVIAEELEQGMEPYMGLRFPASDVPKQVRDLYFRVPYRMIPDVLYKPVKLVPIINPLTNSFTDLSECIFRGVTAVHLEYLQNMKVHASFSFPLINENKLWGLIACHHRTPLFPSFEIRSQVVVLAEMLAAYLSAAEARYIEDKNIANSQVIRNIKSRLHTEKDIRAALMNRSEIINLLNLKGLALITGNNIASKGDLPSEDLIRKIVTRIKLFKENEVYSTNKLSTLFDEALNSKHAASGLIVIPLLPEKDYYLLGFRPEYSNVIKWGGNPNEVVTFEDDGKEYHPRNSFKLWQESIEGQSEPWNPWDLNAAKALKFEILQFIYQNH